ncbi:hypothetical protein [Nonomuraea sp. SBT364]|uniref:hypothetical protein n=1 Tax=Nonomuraea sp. SBT364 TaxID=1580530 RepID=UPI000B081125|nr:hypothetical protein [Nonomuraea sp. SBT364]
MAATCPRCTTALDGGPIVYRCAACRRTVYAADLDTEHHAPANPIVMAGAR